MKQVNDQFLQVFLEEALEMMDNWETLCLNLDSQYTSESLNALFRCAHTLKGSSKAVYLTEFGEVLHKIEDVINNLREGKLNRDRTLELLLDWQRELKTWLQAIQKKSTFNFDHKKFDFGLASLTAQDFINFSELTPAKAAPAPVVKAEEIKVEKVDNSQTSETTDAEPLVTNKKEQGSESPNSNKAVIRVDSGKCDALLHSVGEMALNFEVLKRIISENPALAEQVAQTINTIESINSNLQRDVLSIRMQPLDQFFQRMQRLAKDVSRHLGKKVKMVVHGKSVELDKTVSDKLIDPFVHIIRNAIDHGIEDPKIRVANGKPEEGTLELSAKSTPTGVEISVKDNGKGLDRDLILQRAIDKGIISPGTQIASDKVYELITRPGFTTLDKVSDISGRGIGMDVVAKSIKDLGGTMQILSKKGEGTSFIFNLPTNLSILDAFIVSCSGIRFAILLQEIAQILDLRHCHLKKSIEYEVLNHKDKIIPVLSLSEIFNLPGSRIVDPLHRPAILTEIDDELMVFEVDAIIGKQKIVITENPDNMKIPGVSGMTILDDALPGLIVSIQNIARQML